MTAQLDDILRVLESGGPQTADQLANALHCQRSELYPAYSDALATGLAEAIGTAASADLAQAEGPIRITYSGRQTLRGS